MNEPSPIIAPGELAPGDIVSLVSGGPRMTVVMVMDSDPLSPSTDGKCDNIRCVWFTTGKDNGEWAEGPFQGPFADTFHTGILKLIQKRGGKAPQPEIRAKPEPVTESVMDGPPSVGGIP